MSNLDRLRNRPTRTAEVTLALDPNDADRLGELRRARDLAKATVEAVDRVAGNGDAGRALDAAEALEQAEAELAAFEAKIITFTVHLRGIGPRRVEELMVEHKPTPQQQKKAKQLNNGDPRAQPVFHEDDLPSAVLAEAIEKITFSDDPENPITTLSFEIVHDLWTARWPVGDRAVIFATSQALDSTGSQVEALGKG